jgi:hypothetical protein
VVGYTLVLIPIQLLKASERTELFWRDLAAIFGRLFISFDLFIRNKPVEDQLFFVSIVTLVYWFIGLSAGYWLARHKNFLGVVIPSSLAILTVHAFDAAQPTLGTRLYLRSLLLQVNVHSSKPFMDVHILPR